MTNHLQTILSCVAEPITLGQHVLESVFQLSLIKEGLLHDDANVDNAF